MDSWFSDWRFWSFAISNLVTIACFFTLKLNDFRHLGKDVKEISKRLGDITRDVGKLTTEVGILQERTKDL